MTRRYWHEILGFNYRMTNIAAAIGVAQMERFEEVLERKRRLGSYYRRLLAAVPVTFQERMPDAVGSDWLVSVLLPHGADRDRLMASMDDRGIETRPVFYCAHTMPMHDNGARLPIAEDIAARGISLPSYSLLSTQDIARVVNALEAAMREQGLVH
jgi:perosamine synthetase